MDRPPRTVTTIAILAVTQILSWGTLYYAFAVVAHDIARELALPGAAVFGAFSWCLLVAGITATPSGILIDRHGGRLVMAGGSLLCGLGFIMLSQARGATAYYLAWTVLGAAMPAVLYDAAFATLNRQFGMGARRAISTLTLFGGFASTVFWPLTVHLNGIAGWRTTYLAYGLVQLLLCMPLHLLLSTPPEAVQVHKQAAAGFDFSLRQALRHPAFWKLAFAFSANSFIFSALSAHLIPILQSYGHALSSVVWMAALIGPMQVAGRIGEMRLARHARPQASGTFCFAVLPGALLAMLFWGQHQVAVALFCVLYGLSIGILTIVRGTLPQILFGARHYGAISGALAGPALIARAAGPIAIAALLQFNSSPALLFSLLLGCSLASLLFYLLAVRSGSPAAATAP
ncbi:MFS transporter [Massilia pseudoviolaceinigra]|uniref:MFS transporter n=1 Tax=Massilia pseudoviolaceinigra TaxID=3057165 RepID=UPI00279661AF|nr:MFS transporter [Massilia sp. CCM 9206]MDQ1924865.1 MFS transporter [Massilia sp. CCM 9206]